MNDIINKIYLPDCGIYLYTYKQTKLYKIFNFIEYIVTNKKPDNSFNEIFDLDKSGLTEELFLIYILASTFVPTNTNDVFIINNEIVLRPRFVPNARPKTILRFYSD